MDLKDNYFLLVVFELVVWEPWFVVYACFFIVFLLCKRVDLLPLDETEGPIYFARVACEQIWSFLDYDPR